MDANGTGLGAVWTLKAGQGVQRECSYLCVTGLKISIIGGKAVALNTSYTSKTKEEPVFCLLDTWKGLWGSRAHTLSGIELYRSAVSAKNVFGLSDRAQPHVHLVALSWLYPSRLAHCTHPAGAFNDLKSMASNYDHVPQELIDSIIDCVEERDLPQCSLVSSFWLPRAQSRIFCTISLGPGIQGGLADELVEIPPLITDDENFTRFRDLLRKSPHLSSYIRRLNLGLPPLASEQPEESQWYQVLSPASWQLIEDAVVEIVPLLCNLESLGLFPCGSSRTYTFHLRSRIVEVLRSLSLRSLAFSKWVFRDPLALDPFESHPPSSLRFIECQYSVTLRLSGRGGPPPLSWIAPSLTKSLTIAFDSDSAAFISIGLLEHISLKHIQHLDLLFLDQYKPDRTWLETFFTSIVLKPGATLRVSFSGSSLSVLSWDAGLHSRFNLNPALHFRNLGTRRHLDYNKVVDYDFVWVG
ncbi:hypothetical protein DFH06DRAFT_1432574 [Mycena polygramma]|nr:hypothetical protein DFH06DRAFT_1432574 [Mycena polygramma]